MAGANLGNVITSCVSTQQALHMPQSSWCYQIGEIQFCYIYITQIYCFFCYIMSQPEYRQVTSMFINNGERLVYWFAWMNHCTVRWLYATIWNIDFQKHGPWANHDVNAHHRAKNNGNCHDACAHPWASISPVTPSICNHVIKDNTDDNLLLQTQGDHDIEFKRKKQNKTKKPIQ